MTPLNKYINTLNLYAIKLVYKLRYLLPDKLYLKILFRLKMGYKLNLKNPQTFSEKIQWLKLYDRKPEYTAMVDKFEAKNYVANIIGKEYIIPTLGVWEKPEDIKWDILPQKFVLKTTHGGGSNGVIICENKNAFNKAKAIEELKKSLKQNIYINFREWPYKNIQKRINAEEYIENLNENGNADLADYKFFCFNGKPHFCQVISGRKSKMVIDFFDMDWNHQPFHEPKEFPFADILPKRPTTLNKMVELATKLSKGHAFLRVDFYEINQKIKFGELTFFPTSGMGGFSPSKWDKDLGKLIKLKE